jgi:uncharacterized membrane protein
MTKLNLNKKTIIVFFLIAIAAIAIYGLSRIANSIQVSVKSMDAEITIDGAGNMTIREEWVVRFPTRKSVTFRDIGYGKYDPDDPLYHDLGDTASFDKENVSVKVYDKSRRELRADEYRVGYSFRNDFDEYGQRIVPPKANMETIFVHVYNGMKDEMVFVYNYRILGAVTLYRDIAELNWKLVEYFPMKIARSTVIVNLPSEAVLAWGHGLSNGTVHLEEKSVRFEMKNIAKDDLVEFRILMEPEDFPDVAEKNYISMNMLNTITDYENKLAVETNRRIKVAMVLFYGTFVMTALMAFLMITAYIKYDKEHEPKFTGKYYRELPAEYSPAEMSYLYYFRKINAEDVTATILDLVRRQYLLLDVAGEKVTAKKPDFKLTLNPQKSDLTELLPHERHVVEWFVKTCGNGQEVSFKDIENYPKKNYNNAQTFSRMSRTFVRLAKDAGKKRDFFEVGLDRKKQRLYVALLIPAAYLFISFLIAVPLNLSISFTVVTALVIMVIYGIYVASIDRRSIAGNEDFAKWKAFRQFMLDFGRMKDYPMPGVVIWEHYLVYATSLKIADQVMNQLKVKLAPEELDVPNATFMHLGYRYYGFNLGYVLGRINTSLLTARTNMNTTIVAHHTKKVGAFTGGSGFGRGGGFGGGRSFGGGGGGFRVR